MKIINILSNAKLKFLVMFVTFTQSLLFWKLKGPASSSVDHLYHISLLCHYSSLPLSKTSFNCSQM